MQLLRIATRLAFCVVASTFHSSPAWTQDCDMSGKQIQYRIRICSSLPQQGCQRIRTQMVFVGDQLVEYDDDPKTGTVFHIGQTVEVTDKDIPSTREIVVEKRYAYARVSLSSTMNNGALKLSRTQNFLNNSNQMVLQDFNATMN